MCSAEGWRWKAKPAGNSADKVHDFIFTVMLFDTCLCLFRERDVQDNIMNQEDMQPANIGEVCLLEGHHGGNFYECAEVCQAQVSWASSFSPDETESTRAPTWIEVA